ncbi:hypothetical protein V495_07545 [Pseudogymnoascus sp. VKM F-4514 (FW-929)]|nr:hypothetical protein V495_07545 [Pseudogymnoascus sp. VKM F-4514 (FW-929)]KFY56683.1 hypothetical protein V497_06100 [Pseudogymnoascus sp. VKM F-4516 (FW-969)]
MESQTAKDEAARSTEILHQANVYLEQVKVICFIVVKAMILTSVQLHFQTKPEIYKELFHLLNSYAAARNEAYRHVSTHVETLFHGTAPELPRLRHALTRTVRMERGTPYAAALVNSVINRVTKTTIESTAAEDSCEEIIEESRMKTIKTTIKIFPGFSVDTNLFDGFSQLLPANVYPTVAGRTMATGGASRFHREEGERVDVYEGYEMVIDDFEKKRIRANRRLYVKARILLQDSPQLFEGFQKFMPAHGKGELFRTAAGRLRWRHYNAEHGVFRK